MRRTEMLQEIRGMRFEEVYCGWNESRLSQEEAAQILGVSDRTFRRYINRYEKDGLEGLSDKRLTQASFRRTSAAHLLFKIWALFMNRKTGQFTCYKTGHFYLLLTVVKKVLDKFRQG